jgi:SNF2 family DNA or RNA helicase
MAVKTESKVAVLFYPGKLQGRGNVVESLHIHKSTQGITFELADLGKSELARHHGYLPEPVRELLLQLRGDALNATLQKMVKQSGGNAPDSYIDGLMARHICQLFDKLKPFHALIKWYHRKATPGSKQYTTAACSFSHFRPRLQFTVQQADGTFFIQAAVLLNETVYPLDSFTRNAFLLENRNEYFLLAHQDYKTLEWLEQQLPVTEVNALLPLVTRLEADYPVDRNGLFARQQVEVKPVNRVMLSELNNAFLMLTPQWLYDNIPVDGPWTPTHQTVIQGEEWLIARDQEAEVAFVQLLRSLHPNFAGQRNGYFYLSFAEAQKKQWFLKTYHTLLDQGIAVAGMDLLQHFRYSPHRVHTTLQVKNDRDNRVTLQARIAFGEEEVPLQLIQKTLLSGARAVMLKDGSLGVLDEAWLQEYAPLIKHGKVEKKELEVARFFAFSSPSGTTGEQALRPLLKTEWWEKWKQWQDGEGQPVYALPPTVQATLRPYQQKGFEWLALLAEAGAGACLADDMGLGKTLQTICFLAWYLHHHSEAVNIIVAPSSLIYNWQQELQKFAPSVKATVYHGSNRGSALLDDPQTRVFITSYGTLRADAALLAGRTYGVAILDESHNIKNPASQVSAVASNLAAAVRIALSGTPVVNNTFDLYAQLNYAVPGMFGSREFFRKEYADAIDRFGDEEKIRTLQKLTAPFILRRTKEQVAADLPAKTESVLWCNMGTGQMDLYNEVKEQVRSNIFLGIREKGLGKSKLAVLHGILKLRQICNSPQLLPAEEHLGCTDSVKTRLLLEELQNLVPHHKALVFSQFSSMLDLLATELNRQGIPYYHFDGQTPPEQRAAMVQQFQDPDNHHTAVFLISLKAGNAGLTLTAADYVFLFDPWWNTAVEQQAIDRTHRIGQTKSVFAYKLICKNTIEEKIIQLQQKKKQLAEELVGGDDGFIKALEEEDIHFLFG